MVRKYQELWRELAERRMRDVENAPRKKGKSPIPLRIDPFALFQEYSTGYITADSFVTLQAGKIQGWVEHVTSSVMNNYIAATGNLLLSKDEQAIIIDHLAVHGNSPVAEITKLFPNKKEVLLRTLGWMGKNGIVAVHGSKCT